MLFFFKTEDSLGKGKAPAVQMEESSLKLRKGAEADAKSKVAQHF